MTSTRPAPGDAAVSPGIEAADSRTLMTDMLMARRASERLWNLQRQGRVTTAAPILGQEAAVVGGKLKIPCDERGTPRGG